MKWGVRRYQNPDGTLTPAGKARYYKSDGSLTREGQAWKKQQDKVNAKKQAKEAKREERFDKGFVKGYLSKGVKIGAGVSVVSSLLYNAGWYLATGDVGQYIGKAAADAALMTVNWTLSTALPISAIAYGYDYTRINRKKQ